jgi:c-di-GMP-related signal transduction protein
MLRIPMESIVDTLPIRAEMRAALLGESNAERKILDWLVCHENGEWARCDEIALAAGLKRDNLPQLYAQALLWAEANINLATG